MEPASNPGKARKPRSKKKHWDIQVKVEINFNPVLDFNFDRLMDVLEQNARRELELQEKAG
jgi:hypothetical protein